MNNLSKELYEHGDKFVFISSSINKITDEIDFNLANVRENSKYIVGLLFFLGPSIKSFIEKRLGLMLVAVILLIIAGFVIVEIFF